MKTPQQWTEEIKHAECWLLGQRIVGTIPGVRIRENGGIGKQAVKQLVLEMVKGKKVVWKDHGSRIKVWITD